MELDLKTGYPVGLEDLLKLTVKLGGSDLHLTAGARPAVRINGGIIQQDYPPVSTQDINNLIMPVLDQSQKDTLNSTRELDFSYSMQGMARFRGNIMIQRGSLAAAFRVVPYDVPEFGRLGLPEDIKKLCSLTRGLVLVTGPTGSGKSTTLASMIDIINSTRKLNIVTIEDPIEFLHKHKLSIVRQREVGSDTLSFSNALRHVLRHDPDVILIGEMRDLESIAIALTAAETGHLVLSTLHTQTAPLTITRIVDVFQAEAREQIRQQLANTLKAVVSQQLLPTSDGKSRVVAVEYMTNTNAIRNIIREGKEHQLYNVIQTGQAAGMQTMDQSLYKLFCQGKISRDTAFEYCIESAEMERMLQKTANWGNTNGHF